VALIHQRNILSLYQKMEWRERPIELESNISIEELTPYFPYSTKKREILTTPSALGHPKSDRFPPTRPILVLPVGQSSKISAIRRAGYLLRFLLIDLNAMVSFGS